MSVVLKSPSFDLRRAQIISEIEQAVNPDSITVEKGLSLIAVVGEGMGTIHGTFSRIFAALARAGVKVVSLSGLYSPFSKRYRCTLPIKVSKNSNKSCYKWRG